MRIRVLSSLGITILACANGIGFPTPDPWEGLPEGNLYRDRVIGFSISKPPTWSFVPTGWFPNKLSRVRLPDSQLAEAIATHRGPVVAFVEEVQPALDVTPTVQVTYRPLLATRIHPPDWYLEMAQDLLAQKFTDYEVVERTSNLQVSGFPAAYARTLYTLETHRGQRYRVVAHTWVIRRDRAVFTIGMSGPAIRESALGEVFSHVLESLTIERSIR